MANEGGEQTKIFGGRGLGGGSRPPCLWMKGLLNEMPLCILRRKSLMNRL